MIGSNPTRVLFVGNSYTVFNDMPDMLEQLAAAQPDGKQLAAELVVAGGYTLERHWRESRAQEAIQADRWDYVVLQEQSTRPVEHPDRMREYAHRFVAQIDAVGARSVLYLTWARRNKPEMQSALTRAYLDVAIEGNTMLAPVGPAWESTLTSLPGLVLHKPDRSHHNPIGSYLAACVFFATFMGTSPRGLPHDLRMPSGQWDEEAHLLSDLVGADALKLQSIAWETTQRYAKELTT